MRQTGDLVNKAGDPVEIAEYHRIAAKLDRTIRLYNVAGNHDSKNTPTPETVAAYTRAFGPDHYAFTQGRFVGIVLDSVLVKTPEKVGALAAEQDAWLKDCLRTPVRGARHTAISSTTRIF